MTKQTFLDYAETKKGGILLSSVSVSNNILSAINATDSVADDEQMSARRLGFGTKPNKINN